MNTHRDWYHQHETLPESSQLLLQEALDKLAWNEQGLVPVITQQWNTGEVLMSLDEP